MELVTRRPARRIASSATSRTWSVAILLVVALGACSSTPPAEVDPVAAPAKESNSDGSDVDLGARDRPTDRSVTSAIDPRAPQEDGREPAGDVKPASNVLPLSQHVEIGAGFARVDDPRRDASEQGATPMYAELLEASVVDRGTELELSLTFADGIPDRMPAKTYMAISWTLAPKEDDQDVTSFSAYGSPKGWDTFAGKDGQPAPFIGGFDVDGDRLVMTIGWDELGGPRKLKWHADTSWLLYEDDNTQRTSVDAAPNDGPGAFEG